MDYSSGEAAGGYPSGTSTGGAGGAGGAGAGGYDISPATSRAIASSANQAAGTVINFGEKAYVDGGWYDQTSSPTATSTAATSKKGSAASDNAASGSSSLSNLPQNQKVLFAVIGIAAIALLYMAHKK